MNNDKLFSNPQERKNTLKLLEDLALINSSSSKTEKITNPRKKMPKNTNTNFIKEETKN